MFIQRINLDRPFSDDEDMSLDFRPTGVRIEVEMGEDGRLIASQWRGDWLMDSFSGTADVVLDKVRKMFGDGGCRAGEQSPEELSRTPMTPMGHWLAFDAPDDY